MKEVTPVPPYPIESEEVAMTEPFALVVRRAEEVLEMARFVVVAAPPWRVVYVVRPEGAMEKRVVVIPEALVEATERMVERSVVEAALTVRAESGVVVPMPMLPFVAVKREEVAERVLSPEK